MTDAVTSKREMEAERLAPYFAVQLDFARRMAAGRGIALGEAASGYTNLRRRFGLPEEDPASAAPWAAYLARLDVADPAAQAAWTREVFLRSPEERLPPGQTGFGCFSCEPPDAQGGVRLHFTNRELDGDVGPLDRRRMPARDDELAAMFAFVRRSYPRATRVLGGSWLYNLEAYRRLFPPAYGASRRLRPAPVNLTGTSSWGQLLDRRGGLKRDRALRFADNLRRLDVEAPWRVFPLPCLVAEAPVGLFYEHYGVAP
jgi:hypothetical protein